MHFSISSLPYHFDKLSELLNDLTINVKIIGIRERRLRYEKSSLTYINLPNYEIEHMPTKANKGGALLYISNELIYKVWNSLRIHEDKILELIFIAVIPKLQSMWLLVAFIMSVICRPFLASYLLKTKTLY